MAKYRKKALVIEAFQYRSVQAAPNEAVYADWPQWAKDALKHNVDGMVVSRDGEPGRTIEANIDHLVIHTLEGDHRADDGDWIIKGIAGEFYPCKPDIFEATYDPIPVVA